jgi:hypothetical protein
MVYYVLMSGNMINSKSIVVPESAYGVCYWEKEDGELIYDADMNLLCAQGLVGDRRIEKAVAEAAAYWTGSPLGSIKWYRGARKVSHSELEDQMDRLLSGYVADPFEEAMTQQFRLGGS